jgi:penicillin-binding protein 1A
MRLALAGAGTSQRPRVRGSGDGVGTLPLDPTGNGGGSGTLPPPGRGDGRRGDGSHRPTPSRKPRLKKLRVALVLLGLTLLAAVSWIFGIMMAVASDLPQLEDRAQFASAHNSVIYDDHNHRLALVTNNAGRVLIPSAQIAPVMKEATVAIEDKRFYQHRGVDFVGIGRAFLDDVLHRGAKQGASTITEQFVKNALQAQGSRTVFEKLREAALAYQLERHWDKDKILSEYLNEIYFGEGAYGVESAARTYFGWNHPGCGVPHHRCASELFPWEAAMLAGLISSPAGYDPKTNPQAALARRNIVLQNMEQQGDITPAEYVRYSRVPVPRPGQISAPETPSRAPYFTTWVRQQLIDLYGPGRVFNGGLRVKSTLDLPLEEHVQQIVDSTLGGLGGPSSAVVVLDNATGGVRAMVGGLDYHSQAFNIATEGARQPGSAFKPFTLVTALEDGISPETTFTSAPQHLPYRVKFKNKRGKTVIKNDIFDVQNYQNEYGGVRSIFSGTTFSDNAVYSQLGMRVGPANVAETAHKMGIPTSALTSPDLEYSVNGGPFTHYNPALILGGLSTGVNPLEMAHAYDTLAANGRLISGTMATAPGAPVGILKVTDSSDHVVTANNGAPGINRVESEQVIPASVAEEAKSILETVVSEGTGTHAQTGQYEWGKTGTTTDNGDAWFVGATRDITVAVWVGYPNSTTPMKTLYSGGPVDGGTYPADIFRQIVEAWGQINAEERHAHHVTTIPSSSTSSSSSSYTPSTTTVAPPSTTAVPSAPPSSAPATGGGATQSTGQAAPAAPAAPTQPAPAPAPTPAPTPPASSGTGGAGAVSGGGGVGAG